MKNSLLLSALLIFACSTDSEGNPCIYEPTLTTEAATDITETSATLNGVISIVSENCEVALGEMQGFVYSTNSSPTNDDNVEVVYGTDISTSIEGLEPETTYYVRVFLTNTIGEFYGDEVSFITLEEGCDIVYLDDNGVTIKACDDANIGDVGTVNGVEYTVVDRDALTLRISNDEDVSKVCTSLILNMNGVCGGSILFGDITLKDFNQDISSWDVSNVTNMRDMFKWSNFNQDISNWDVGNVTMMMSMFNENSAFNQPIGNWDVSNVTDMGYMFTYTPFNQDIGGWDVSNVSTFQSMFIGTPFNQDIGGWDVSNVSTFNSMFTDSAFNQDISNWDTSSGWSMESMFRNSPFNQNIGNWDVSSVTNMYAMFGSNQVFNQDISNWDTSSVNKMHRMFYGSLFNQDIGGWDVSNVSLMYNMFTSNLAFNQDLSDWNVVNTIECDFFSDNTPSWTLPQPNFTNCTP